MTLNSVIKIFIVEDHPIVRLGIRRLLEDSARIVIAGEADNGLDAVSLIDASVPDVVITDLTLPGLGGLEVIKRIRQSNIRCPIVVLSMHSSVPYVARALEAGASAYVIKDSAAETLMTALRTVLNGGTYISPAISMPAVDTYQKYAKKKPDEALSAREREVLSLIAEGLNNPEIAERLTLSSRTVETHRRNIQNKLGLKSQGEVVRAAVEISISSGGGRVIE